MTDLLHKEDVENEARREQAQRAVAAFRRLQPTLTSYAKVLSGNPKARVELSTTSNGSSVGDRIFYRPPIALGDNTPHSRRLCDQRGSDGIMLCEACAIREEVLVTIYHEIFHIAFDSFARITDNDKRNTIEFALKEISGPWAERVRRRIEGDMSLRGYMQLASVVNQYLPYLVNSLEDARVNTAGFEARKGVKKMFEADEQRIFNRGFESAGPNGSVKMNRWDEQPLNNQVMIGVYCKAIGYDYSNWFHPKVVEALGDPDLTYILRGMSTIRSASAVYNLALKVLARLRELGFLATPEDPNPQPQPQPEDQHDTDDSSSDSGEGADSGDGNPDDSPASGMGSGAPVPPEVPDDQDDTSRPDDSDSDEPEAGSDGSKSDDELRDQDDSDGHSGEDGDSESHGSDEADSEGGSPGDQPEPSPSPVDSPDSAPGDSTPEGRDEEAGDDSSEPMPEGNGGGIAGSGDIDSPDSGGAAGDEDSERESGSDSEDSSSQDDSGSDLDSEPIDTGADDGYGGTELVEKSGDSGDEPDYGTPEDLDPSVIEQWMGHEKPTKMETVEDEKAVETAIVQGMYFTRPSVNIRGVQEYHFDASPPENQRYFAWSRSKQARAQGQDGDFDVPEPILQPALLRTRRVFSDNRRGRYERNKRSGHINAKSLGKRAPMGDDRLFAKRYLPGQRDYFVVIGMDVSGSTVGLNLALEKRAVLAQAELLERVGIEFAIYAHSGSPKGQERHEDEDLDVYVIKERHDKWTEKVKHRLECIGSSAFNLDGHAMEYLRKKLEESDATDKIMLYYSDGKMPAENGREELEILQREIAYCRRKGITLLGVGIRTDSPAQHGLETVQVDTDEDLIKVVELLGKRLGQRRE